MIEYDYLTPAEQALEHCVQVGSESEFERAKMVERLMKVKEFQENHDKQRRTVESAVKRKKFEKISLQLQEVAKNQSARLRILENDVGVWVELRGLTIFDSNDGPLYSGRIFADVFQSARDFYIDVIANKYIEMKWFFPLKGIYYIDFEESTKNVHLKLSERTEKATTTQGNLEYIYNLKDTD